MEFQTDAMPAKLGDHRKTRVGRNLVDRRAHVAQMRPRLHRRKAGLHRIVRDVDQAAPLVIDVTDAEHARRIREVPIEDRRHVHVDDIATLEHVILARDAMANDFVYRGAHALGKPLVIEVGGNRPMLDAVVVNPAVDFLGARPGTDMFGNVVERTDVDARRCLDSLDFLGRLEPIATQDDLAGIV